MSDTVPARTASIPKPSARRTRVKLRRINCDYSKPYPPDGDGKLWWDRLKAALGTTSSDFVSATLVQIQNASRLPTGGICEMSVNAVLAFIEAAEPKNEIEAALAIQMACTHAVAMAILSRAGGAYGGDRHVALLAAAGARLLKAFTAQVETLRRVRNGSSQYMRVEHISNRVLKRLSGKWRSPMVHDAIRRLHQLAHAAISGQTGWPASPDDSNSIWKMLADSGLTEELPDGTTRYTEVGSTAEIKLLLVCIGALCPWEMPFFLEKHGYASEEEAMDVWEAETDDEGLRLLKLIIFRAYAGRFQRSICRH